MRNEFTAVIERDDDCCGVFPAMRFAKSSRSDEEKRPASAPAEERLSLGNEASFAMLKDPG